MPRRSKATIARMANLKATKRSSLPDKRRKFTPAEPNLSDDDEVVMDNKMDEDEDIPNGRPDIQNMIEQGDALEATTSVNGSESRFRVAVKKGALAAVPPGELSYFEWSIASDPKEINGRDASRKAITKDATLNAEETGERNPVGNEN